MRPRIRDLGAKVAEPRDRRAELIAPIDSVEPKLPGHSTSTRSARIDERRMGPTSDNTDPNPLLTGPTMESSAAHA